VTKIEEALRRFKDGAENARQHDVVAPVESRRVQESERPAPVYRGRPIDLDKQMTRANRFVLSDDRARRLADEFRVIKRPLLKLATATGPDRLSRGNGILVASAAPGEGKTFVSLSLARSIAVEPDLEVLLVDADFKKQELTQLSGLAGEPGLLDVLAGRSELADVVHPTERPGLAFIPAGEYRDNANELLASRLAHERLGQFLNDGRRVIVFDSAPVLYSAEPQVLAALAGQIVFVVRAGVTQRRGLTEALAKLGPTKPRNIVINDADSVIFSRGSSHLYDYYGSPQHLARQPE
jgi:receptor protein-tyrosine kinase